MTEAVPEYTAPAEEAAPEPVPAEATPEPQPAPEAVAPDPRDEVRRLVSEAYAHLTDPTAGGGPAAAVGKLVTAVAKLIELV